MEMQNNPPPWQWNEFQQIGTDYASMEEVANYDRRMRKMRDVEAENREILELLKLPPSATVLEIGTGTGAFLRTAAKHCAHAVGIDISQVMLRYVRARADEEKIRNIELRRAGFLTCTFAENTFDGVVSGLAFHHLPDLWKAVALERIYKILRPGGSFLLLDVVFDWKTESPEAYFDRIVATEKESRPNFIRHIAREYSTLAWIMEGLLTRAGFVIGEKRAVNDFLTLYRAEKPD